MGNIAANNNIVAYADYKAEWMNADNKEKYITFSLNAVGDKEGTEKTLRAFFNQVAQEEQQYGLDICEFVPKQLIETFITHGWINAATFTCYRSLLRKYTDWCMQQNLVDCNAARQLNINQFNNVEKLVSNRSKYFYNIDELMTAINVLYENKDQYVMAEAFWYLAWLGFSRDEARHITKAQVKENSIITDDWEVVNIPDKIMRTFRRAVSLEEYSMDVLRRGKIVHKTMKLVDNPYLLRSTARTVKTRSEEPCGYSILDGWGQVVRNLQRELPFDTDKSIVVINKSITFQRVHMFGRFVALNAWELNNGEATNDNMMDWCKVVRRYDYEAQCPKNSCNAFLLSYCIWKNTKPNNFQ